MSKVMLINVSHEEESRVAIVQGGVLESLEIESISRSLKGNIYKGTINNVNAALEAAFVFYGDERAAFLPLDEVNFKVLPTLPGHEGHRGRGRITDHLQPGREVLVQVVRDAFNSKPPTLSTFYSLPGRYLVLTPKSDGQGISRKIEDSSQRDRLKKIVEELNPPEGFGVIVRTAGMDQSKTELQRDLKYLLRLWEAIETAAAVHRAPSLIYQERDVVLRTIRDHFTPEIEEVLIDDQHVYDKARRFVQAVMPAKEKLFKFYTGDKPLFSKYNLEDQIESIFRREVSLKSGGAIVIDETEALTAVDVNSARSAREGNIEDTALRTNLEAAEEVARQLRLRDLGGLIVVDFIDMYQDKNVRQVEKTMRDALRKDKAKYDVTRISKFGLMEISRQRMKVAKASAAYSPCVRCEGTGVVKTTEAAALSVLRRVQARVVKGDLASLRATVPEEVAVYLLNQKREELSALERRYGTRIAILPHPSMNPNRGEIDTVVRDVSHEPPPVHSVQKPLIPEEITAGLAAEAAAFQPLAEAEEQIPSEGEPEAVAEASAEPSAVEAVPSENNARALASPASVAGKKKRRRRRKPRRPGSVEEVAAGNALEQAHDIPGSSRTALRASETGDIDLIQEGEEAGQAGVSIVSPGSAGGQENVSERRKTSDEEDAPQVLGVPDQSVRETRDSSLGFPPAQEDPSAAGVPSPPRRRRRRRRRSRRPVGQVTPAIQGVARAAPAAQEDASDSSDVQDPAVPFSPPPAPAKVASSWMVPRAKQPTAAPANESRPEQMPAAGQSQAEEEEIPGGWWQKLTGGSRKGGRGDQED